VQNNSSCYLLTEVLEIAQKHIKTIEQPHPGFQWPLEFEQELTDAWLFAYKFYPVNPQVKESVSEIPVSFDQSNSDDPFVGESTGLADYPFIAGAFGFSFSKENGQIQDWGAGKWSEIKQKGRINF